MKQKSRILAIDLRESRFGYAALEMPGKLLDFGVATFNSPEEACRRLAILVRVFRPSVLVLDRGTGHGRRNKRRIRSILRMMRIQGQQASVSVAMISKKALRRFFVQQGARNKDATAQLLSSWFSKLLWKMPPKRKCYQTEWWIMAAFDAVALGVIYLVEHNPDAVELFRRLPVHVQTA
jgi:hypothetical protein